MLLSSNVLLAEELLLMEGKGFVFLFKKKKITAISPSISSSLFSFIDVLHGSNCIFAHVSPIPHCCTNYKRVKRDCFFYSSHNLPEISTLHATKICLGIQALHSIHHSILICTHARTKIFLLKSGLV